MLMCKNPYQVKVAILLACVITSATRASAASPSSEQKLSARVFLEDRSRAKGILLFAHPMVTLTGFEMVRSGGVSENGRTIPGEFYLEYRYSWKGDLFGEAGSTNLLYFFNRYGKLTSLRAEHTSSGFAAFGAATLVLEAAKADLRNDPEVRKNPWARNFANVVANEADVKKAIVGLLNLERSMQ